MSDLSGSATDRALALPEILALVLDFLTGDTFSLASVIRVNSFWNKHGVSVLWREPPSRVLLHMPKERRQRYADHIHAFAFGVGEDANAHPQPTESVPLIRQYLQPNLIEFEFYGGDVHDDLRTLLSERCPKLEKLLIDNIGSDFRADDFSGFLNQFRMLEDITLYFDIDERDEVPIDVFWYLAKRDPLDSLVLRNLLTAPAIHRVAETVNNPFENLSKLSMRIPPNLLPAVVPMIKRLRELELAIDFDTGMLEFLNILPRVLPVPDLEILSVRYYGVDFIDVEEFLALKKFTKLRELTISGQGFASLPNCHNRDPKNLRTTLEHLPLLEKVGFDVVTEKEIALLAALGQSCPLLEQCSLAGSFELEELSRFAAPLLPSLTTLQVDEVVTLGLEREEPPLRAIALQLQRHAPKLTELDVTHQTDFSRDVVNCWKELLPMNFFGRSH